MYDSGSWAFPLWFVRPKVVVMFDQGHCIFAYKTQVVLDRLRVDEEERLMVCRILIFVFAFDTAPS